MSRNALSLLNPVSLPVLISAEEVISLGMSSDGFNVSITGDDVDVVVGDVVCMSELDCVLIQAVNVVRVVMIVKGRIVMFFMNVVL
jgi:hypothetical protein